MTQTALQVRSTRLPATGAATAWLNAFLATGQSEDRPALCRTLAIEAFPQGVQFIGCDGTLLFRAWAGEPTAWPDVSEAALWTAVVMDPDGFALSFMRTLLATAKASDHPELHEVTFEVTAIDSAEPALGDDFRAQQMVLHACGQQLSLRLYEDEYPNWRALRLGVQPIERVDGLRIALRMVKTLAKLKGVVSMDLDFHGKDRHIAFTAQGEAAICGVVMPMRKAEEYAPKSTSADEDTDS